MGREAASPSPANMVQWSARCVTRISRDVGLLRRLLLRQLLFSLVAKVAAVESIAPGATAKGVSGATY